MSKELNNDIDIAISVLRSAYEDQEDREYGAKYERVIRTLNKVRDAMECDTCRRGLLENDTMLPNHTASSGCESGKRNHCTCDACY